MTIPAESPLADAVTDAIRAGDVATLRDLLAAEPDLATARVGARSLLHLLTDHPGHRPNGVETLRVLLAAGADVNARFGGAHTETPLHWAASNDDVALVDALLDAGADIDAPGAVVDGGPPLADAVAFGQWRAARRLVERGAVTNLWQAAALGLRDRVAELAPAATADELAGAFWCACHGGRLDTAQDLANRGADTERVGWDGLTPLDAAVRAGADDVAAWLRRGR